MKTSEILFWLSIIVVFIPIISQWFIGKILVRNNNSRVFDYLYGFNIFLQFVVTGLSFIIQGESFQHKAIEIGWGEPPYNTAPPIIGFPISFILGVILLIMGYNQMGKIHPKERLKKTIKQTNN